IMPVQVLDSTGVGQDSDIVNGVIWATDNGANVVLMPFSNGGFSQTLQDAVSYAWSKGVVLVAATGNDSSSSATYPAGDTDVVGVSATDQNDALWSGSNYGADTFIAAPGVDVPTTEAGGAYITITGTSASSAMVAGVVAFERAMDPAASNSVIVGRLAQDADPAGTASETGNGRVNMQRVVADASRVSATPIGVPGGGPLFGPYTIAALQDGDGSMAVTATTAIAGSSGNSFTFTFTAGSNGGNMNGGAVAINVPSGWTTPQTTSSASPGFISTPTGNCGVASTSITGTGPWTVTFVIDVCSTNKQFTFTYAGGGTKVSAPTGAMAYQFTTQTKANSGGTLKDIQPPQPTITVNPGTASKLVFTSSALNFSATSSPTGGPITIQSQDNFGNPSNPSTAETIALSSSSPDSPKFSLTSGGGTIPSVSIPSSVNNVSIFYGGTTAATPTITPTASGAYSSTPTQVETVTAAAASKLVFTSSALSFAATSSPTAGPITIQSQDRFRNPTLLPYTTLFRSSSSSPDSPKFSLTSGGGTIPSVSIPSSVNNVSIFYGGTTAATPTITPTASGAYSSTPTQVETVTAAAASKLVFTSSALSFAATSSPTAGPITIQSQDRFRNPTLLPYTTLFRSSSSSPDSPKFSLTSGGGTIPSVSIPSSVNNVSIFYGGTTAATPTITPTASGAYSSTPTQVETVTAAAASKLVFTSSALSFAATSSPTAGPITIQSQDRFRNPTLLPYTTLFRSSSSSPDSPKFSLTSGGGTIPSVSIPSSVNKIGRASCRERAGTPTITATGSGDFSSTPTQVETVTAAAASKLVFTSSALSFAATSSPTGGPITIQSQDSFGNPSLPSTAETIALSSSSPDSPKFSLTSGGGTIPSVSIPSSVNSVTFFYGDTKAGTPTVTATGSGGFSST